MNARGYDIDQFLKDIEDDFKYTKFFHSQKKILLEKQYVPIRVALERKHPSLWKRLERNFCSSFFSKSLQYEAETSWGYAESEKELRSDYPIKALTGAESRVERQVSWEEAKGQHRRIMVLADSGMGKSTLLKMEATLTAREERRKLSKNEKDVDDVIFPIVLRLYELDAREEEISQAIPILISQNYPRTPERIIHLLRAKLKEGKCLLLLDALNEVPKERRSSLSEKLNLFARDHPCPIICTSRIIGYTGAFLDGAKEVRIVPFSREQIEQYVQNWFTNAAGSINNDSASADGLIRELRNKPQIQGSAQIPLLLSLICSLYQERESALPTRRCQIYEKALECMLSKWSQNRKPQSKGWVRAKIRLLEELAYHFTCESKEIFSSDDLYSRIEGYLHGEEAPIELRDSATSELIKELSEKDGIIQLEKNGERYIFPHWSFQEYLTASYLNRAKNGIELAREHLWEYDWHDTLSLFAGLMKDPVPLLQVIIDEKDDIFSSLLLLAGRCIAECEEYPHPLVAEIIDRIYELWRNYPSVDFISSVVCSLGRVTSRMSEKLQAALNDKYSEIREAAAKALAEIGNQQAIEPLIRALKDEDSDVRWKAAGALAEIGGQQVVELLIQTLKDEDSDVRRCTVWTLGRIGGQQVVNPLIQALEDKDSSVRYYAAWALGEVGSEQSIEPLIRALKAEDSNVRGAAAKALAEIGSQQAVQPLIQALKDADSDIRWAAAEVLAEIGSQQAIKPLIQALKDEDSDIRGAAARALGEISSEQAIEPLVQMLKDEDSSVRHCAIYALGEIGSQQVVEPLTRTLSDEDSDVREATAEALGKLGSLQVVELLIQTLNDDDSFVRGAAIEALGKLGSEHAIEPLIQALNDEYSDVRWAAASALGEMGSQQAIEPLIEAFKDQYSDVREAAARALGKIGSQQTVNALVQALNDENRLVRRGAAWALGETGSRQAIDALIQALSHEYSDVRLEAAKVLVEMGGGQAVQPLTYVPEHKRRYIRETTAKAWGEIDSQQVLDALIYALNDEDSRIGSYAAETLKKIGTPNTLEKILQSPVIDIYKPEIFSTARTLAVKFSDEETPFIPVYPELLARHKLSNQF